MRLKEFQKAFAKIKDLGYVPSQLSGEAGVSFTLEQLLVLALQREEATNPKKGKREQKARRSRPSSRKKFRETCNECGRSVAFDSGLFVNRVMDFDDVCIRKEMGKPYPYGAFICRECDAELSRWIEVADKSLPVDFDALDRRLEELSKSPPGGMF